MSSFHMIFFRFGEMMSRPGSVMMGGMPAIGRPCLLIRDRANIMHCLTKKCKHSLGQFIFQRTKHTSIQIPSQKDKTHRRQCKMSSSKKVTWTLRQVFICMSPRTRYPRYSILIHIGKGRARGVLNQREGERGNSSQSWV